MSKDDTLEQKIQKAVDEAILKHSETYTTAFDEYCATPTELRAFWFAGPTKAAFTHEEIKRRLNMLAAHLGLSFTTIPSTPEKLELVPIPKKTK